MGRKIVLTGTKLTDLTAPKLATIDSILPESGALMLIDPSNPTNLWPAIDLNSSSVNVPNLAFAQAQALIPTGTTTTLGALYAKSSTFLNNGVTSKVERTGKGGLHVLFSQTTGDNTVARSIDLFAGAAINNYLFTNKAHSYYFASWGRITRGALAYDNGAEPRMSMNGNSSQVMFYTRPTGTGETQYPTANPPRLNHFGEGVMNTVGKVNTPIFQDIQMSDLNTLSVAPSLKPFYLSAQAATNYLKASSMVFYGFYLEDLTVSGRTYAQVNALVKAKYDKDVKTAGGRYYNDTFTDPATMP